MSRDQRAAAAARVYGCGHTRRRGSRSERAAAQDPLDFLPTHLQELIRRGEGPGVEFKSRLPEARRLARLLAALANGGGGVILTGIDDHGRVSGETALADVEAGLEKAAAGLEPRPLISSTAWEDGGRCVVEVRVRPPAQRGPVREVFGPAGTVLVRLNDHVQPVARLPESVQWSASERLSSLPANTRERFRRFSLVGSGARRFRVQEYGHAANVSLHTARRDVVWLVRACLVFEVQKGLFETVRFEEDDICGR